MPGLTRSGEAERLNLHFKVDQLSHELEEASAELQRHHKLIVKLKAYIEDQQKLLLVYRTQGRPSGKLLDRLAAHREFLAREVG